MTEAQARTLRYFQIGEFKNAPLVDFAAAIWLDEIRAAYGHVITVTGDGRLAGDVPSGGSATSLHYLGRAFDLRFPETPELCDLLDRAVTRVSGERAIEREWVNGSGDRHFHIGLYPEGSPRRSRLLIRAD